MDIKISIPYPERLFKFIREYKRNRSRINKEDNRRELKKAKYTQRFLAANPRIKKIYIFISIIYVVGVIPLIFAASLRWLLSKIDIEMPEVIVTVAGWLFLSTFAISIISLVVLAILERISEGKKLNFKRK